MMHLDAVLMCVLLTRTHAQHPQATPLRMSPVSPTRPPVSQGIFRQGLYIQAGSSVPQAPTHPPSILIAYYC